MKKESDSLDSGMGRENSGREGRGYSQSQNQERQPWNQEEQGGLRELLLAELKDIYWAEQELVKALPKIAEKATSDELAEAITNHLEETQEHVSRLEKIFSQLGEEAEAERCEAMAGLLEEGENLMDEMKEGKVRDAAIIASAQKVEHYEIATYGTLVAFAETLGETEIADLLQETLDEEKAADETLTDIAMSGVNDEAAGNEGEGQYGGQGYNRGQGQGQDKAQEYNQGLDKNQNYNRGQGQGQEYNQGQDKSQNYNRGQGQDQNQGQDEDQDEEYNQGQGQGRGGQEKSSAYGNEHSREGNTTGELNQGVENPEIEEDHLRGQGKDKNPSGFMKDSSGSGDEKKPQ